MAALRRFAPLTAIVALLFLAAVGGAVLANNNQTPDVDPREATVSVGGGGGAAADASTRPGKDSAEADPRAGDTDPRDDAPQAPDGAAAPAPAPAPVPVPAPAPQPQVPAPAPAPQPPLNYQYYDDDWDDDWDDDDGDDDDWDDDWDD